MYWSRKNMNSSASKLNNSMKLKIANLRSRIPKYMKHFCHYDICISAFLLSLPKQANAGLPSNRKFDNCCRQSHPGRSQLASTCQWWYTNAFLSPQITDIMTWLSKNEFGPRLRWDTTISMACTSWAVWTLEPFCRWGESN